MKTNELLFDLDQLAQDFMGLAVDTAGATSGIAAECSQRLRELHDEFTDRFSGQKDEGEGVEDDG